MSQKDMKKIISYSIPILALGLATFLGLNEAQQTELQTALDALASVVLTIIGILGVVKSHDKNDDDTPDRKI